MKMRESKKCPKCGNRYSEPSALSREDNETLICPDCGLREALASFGMNEAEWEPVVKIVHEQNNKH